MEISESGGYRALLGRRFLLSGFEVPIKRGQHITAKLRVTKDAAPVEFTGTVVRVDEPEKGNLAVQFVDLDDATMTLRSSGLMARVGASVVIAVIIPPPGARRESVGRT